MNKNETKCRKYGWNKMNKGNSSKDKTKEKSRKELKTNTVSKVKIKSIHEIRKC